MELDESKNFVLIEDNYDGTTTVTLNVEDLPPLTKAVLTMSFKEIVTTFGANQEQMETIQENAILIPNDLPED